MLRAITADYCSDDSEKAWTADGTPLFWTDARQGFPLQIQGYVSIQNVPFVKQVEAAWGPQGELLCLNEPRRTPSAKLDSDCTSPAVVRADVIQKKACKGKDLSHIPRCDRYLKGSKAQNPWHGAAASLAKAYVLTVNNFEKKADYCPP